MRLPAEIIIGSPEAAGVERPALRVSHHNLGDGLAGLKLDVGGPERLAVDEGLGAFAIWIELVFVCID